MICAGCKNVLYFVSGWRIFFGKSCDESKTGCSEKLDHKFCAHSFSLIVYES